MSLHLKVACVSPKVAPAPIVNGNPVTVKAPEPDFVIPVIVHCI